MSDRSRVFAWTESDACFGVTMKAVRVLLMLCVLPATIAVHADSDGLFCANERFVAVESRSFTGDGSHRVEIFPLSGDRGFGAKVAIEIPDFQAHSMRCEANEIVLLSMQSRHLIERVNAHSFRYVGSSACGDCAEAVKRERATPIWSSRTEDQTIPSLNDSGREYELVFLRHSELHSSVVEHTTVAKVVMTMDGEFKDSRVIYARTRLETID